MEGAMIFELAFPYLPVLVIGIFWVVAIRPVLRLTHLTPFAAPSHARRPRAPGALRPTRSGR
jgi:hypothetical protein